jgi:hypothetical protein
MCKGFFYSDYYIELTLLESLTIAGLTKLINFTKLIYRPQSSADNKEAPLTAKGWSDHASLYHADPAHNHRRGDSSHPDLLEGGTQPP